MATNGWQKSKEWFMVDYSGYAILFLGVRLKNKSLFSTS
jgi:hypothetical protein